MPLDLPDTAEKRTKSWHPFYHFAATIMNTSSLTRRACDIYEEIEAGVKANVWTAFQIARANELRSLYRWVRRAEGGSNVFKGAHLVLNDGAAWYYYWASLITDPSLGSERWSSHYDKSRKHFIFSREMQFEIYFPWNGAHMNWGAVLFGRYQTFSVYRNRWETQARTWFQTEAHSTTRPGLGGKALDPVTHIATGWVPYKLSGQNVGPRGLSENTESNHLYVANPPNPPSTPGLAGAQVQWPEMVAVGRYTYVGCVSCDKEHGIARSLVNHWHRCTNCDRIYCPKHGKALPGNNWFDRTRDCDQCGTRTARHRTELV